MTDIAVRVESLSKQYRIGARQPGYRTIRETMTDLATAPLRRLRSLSQPSPESENIWALKDVSFEVKKGEVVGIIGRNGAGKTTLLRILSRITEPTEGYAEIKGRVGSLLEVGTGFHPELTGRENIYLNGAILGMKRAEIDERFDEIVAFSEIEKFLDTPVKRYSSGMHVRLAFSVAAHLEPEILLVDEVLAVGDAAFQKKCLGKMEDVAQHGRTVLFVSHNMQAVSTLTERVVLLAGGRCMLLGPTQSVIQRYLGSTASRAAEYTDVPSPSVPKVTSISLRTSEPGNVQISGKPMDLVFRISTPVRVPGASFSFQVCDALQRPLIHLWTYDSEAPLCREPGVYELRCTVPKVRLYMGQYSLTVHLAEGPGGKKLQTLEGVCPFEVVLYGMINERQWQTDSCVYMEEASWRLDRIATGADSTPSESNALSLAAEHDRSAL